ncbi:UNVERIFIED_CONTAM: hypothetical protein Scaly_2790400 [Sesamum calycinum]|uniref:Uncharacterized protein n=1 Tax=Sesamum calycinum TaxID=2727403 RepID=A0AAW2IWB2_9LAMI
MKEDQDEKEDVAAENDDWAFEGDELVDNHIRETDKGKKSKAKEEDSDAEELTVDDTDLDNWSGEENLVKGECTFQIIDYVPEHTCNISFNVRNMKSNWLSKKYFHKFKTDPKRTVKGFRNDAIEEVRCDISINQATKAKKLAMLMLQGNPSAQYALLWDYADEVKECPIIPINGSNELKKTDLRPPVPPKAVKRVGRPPKSSRRLEPGEATQKQKKRRGAPIMKEGSSKIKRQQTTVKCGKYDSQGHNARGCAIKTASNEPIPDASGQVL